ncbi:MAG: hemerythrin family protein [Candidatus Margulisbacteria bacterium]|nr:hemerythrin family protein [Candidatus Margulisiibacteriota bacterium]
MTPKWTPDLSLGNAKIDNHHKELFHLVSMLDNAIQLQNDRDKVDQIIRFLEDYVVTHFKEEEDVMKTHHFDGLIHHHQEHEIFYSRVQDLRQAYNDQATTPTLVYTIRKLVDKLVTHIQTVDIKMASLYQGTEHEKSSHVV